MPTIKLLNIFALSTLAVLLCSFAPSQTAALSIQPNHLARHVPNHHNLAKKSGIAKKKKRGTKRCKPKSSTPTPGPTNDTTNNNNSSPQPTSPPPDNNTNTPYNTPYPTTTTTTSPANSSPSNPPTNTPTGPGKLGVAWALGDDSRLSLIVGGGRVKIIHLWDCIIPDSVKNTGLPVSIMLWGTDQDRINSFVQYAKPGYAAYAYGFNEVNEPGQANVDPSTALGVWNQYIKPLAGQGYTLGGPVTSSNPNGFDWMTQFFGMCGGDDCGVQEVPIHWYDVDINNLKSYIDKWAGFGKPMRLTEFACQNFNGGEQPSTDQIWSFTMNAISMLEGDGRILSYAPFGFMDSMFNVNPADCLFVPGDTSTLSALGWAYVKGT